MPATETIVSAGRFVREKGFDVLVRAMADVDARPRSRRGWTAAGRTRSALTDLGLGRRVIFPGRVTLRVTGSLRRAVLTGVPSAWGEPFGYPAAAPDRADAARAGRPRASASARPTHAGQCPPRAGRRAGRLIVALDAAVNIALPGDLAGVRRAGHVDPVDRPHLHGHLRRRL